MIEVRVPHIKKYVNGFVTFTTVKWNNNSATVLSQQLIWYLLHHTFDIIIIKDFLLSLKFC